MTEHPRDAEAAEPFPEAPEASREEAGGELDPGVFGKLPRSRPGARSPRRRQSGARSAASAGPATARARAPSPASSAARASAASGRRASASGARRAPQSSEREAAAPAESGEAAGGGIEDLAWAGIAVTAEAATLGVRLLSRAIDAARRATERR